MELKKSTSPGWGGAFLIAAVFYRLITGATGVCCNDDLSAESEGGEEFYQEDEGQDVGQGGDVLCFAGAELEDGVAD